MVVDADVILRYLTNDDPQKADRFESFVTSGKKASLTDVTFSEIYWTLRSFYKFPKTKIIHALERLIEIRSIVCDLELLQSTLVILRKHNVSLIDAYNAAYSILRDDRRVLSFDRDFDRLPGIKRLEP